MKSRGGAKNITAEDFMHNPALIMAVSAVLMIIGAFGKWATRGTWIGYPGVYGNLSGLDHGAGVATLFMGLIMLYSTAVKLGYVDMLKELVPVLNTSAICGSVTFILALGVWGSYPGGGGWGLYLTLIASLVAMFATYRAYMGTSRGLGLGR